MILIMLFKQCESWQRQTTSVFGVSYSSKAAAHLRSCFAVIGDGLAWPIVTKPVRFHTSGVVRALSGDLSEKGMCFLTLCPSSCS